MPHVAIELDEHAEHFFLIFGRDADAAVAHGDRHAIPERLRRHPIYKRVVRLSSKFKAHDEENTAHVGDTVRIEESRPLSREKRWTVIEVVARGSGEELVDTA